MEFSRPLTWPKIWETKGNGKVVGSSEKCCIMGCVVVIVV